MAQFKVGQIVYGETSGMEIRIEQHLGGGGQGDVYRASQGGIDVAVKWYHPQTASAFQRENLAKLTKQSAPNENFLWPKELVSAPNVPGYGYVMPLREQRYKGLEDWMKKKVDPSFRSLATTGYEVSNSFKQLHSKGLCYRDISFGNVFFDPSDGSVLICDNDNVVVNSCDCETSVIGTPRFMAPEIVRGVAKPSTNTDLFSLAVLLFYIFVVQHPLEGKKESTIKCFDALAMQKIYGEEPVFIFDPNNDSNRPVKGYQDNALIYWPLYPHFLQELFSKSFTEGIRDPNNGRVMESEWRSAMIKLRDLIVVCPICKRENFFDPDSFPSKQIKCWNCKRNVILPFRLILKDKLVILNLDTMLFAHHVDPHHMYDFSQPIAKVDHNPQDPRIWGLKNLSVEKWVATLSDGSRIDIEPGRAVRLSQGIIVNFGACEGEFL